MKALVMQEDPGPRFCIPWMAIVECGVIAGVLGLMCLLIWLGVGNP